MMDPNQVRFDSIHTFPSIRVNSWHKCGAVRRPPGPVQRIGPVAAVAARYGIAAAAVWESKALELGSVCFSIIVIKTKQMSGHQPARGGSRIVESITNGANGKYLHLIDPDGMLDRGHRRWKPCETFRWRQKKCPSISFGGF